MKTFKSLYITSFIGGLIILAIGIYLQISQSVAGGISYTIQGDSFQGTITGTSGIIMGIVILVFSGLFYSKYKMEKKRYEGLDED